MFQLFHWMVVQLNKSKLYLVTLIFNYLIIFKQIKYVNSSIYLLYILSDHTFLDTHQDNGKRGEGECIRRCI